MELNTNDILGVSGELLNTTGLTFHRIETQWGDTTTDRSLYGYEVDRNFFNLKAQDIKEAYISGDTITLLRWNGEEINVVIKDIENLSEAQAETSEEVSLLKASTEESLDELCSSLKAMSGIVATQEWVIGQGYLTEEKAEDLYVLKETLDKIISEWANKNLKTINCISLVGCGNIIIGGGSSSGATISIEGDSAITVTTRDYSTVISVKVAQKPSETVESGYYSRKNFLHIDENQNALVVNGVDSDAVYVSKDIVVSGSQLADIVEELNLFDNNIIPEGTNLQDVLDILFPLVSKLDSSISELSGVVIDFETVVDDINNIVSGIVSTYFDEHKEEFVGPKGERGSKIFYSEMTWISGSGVDARYKINIPGDYLVNDSAFEWDNQNSYTCIEGGDEETSVWIWAGKLAGPQGPQGEQGNVNIQVVTEMPQYPSENTLYILVSNI